MFFQTSYNKPAYKVIITFETTNKFYFSLKFLDLSSNYIAEFPSQLINKLRFVVIILESIKDKGMIIVWHLAVFGSQ